jgi:hypothetical protein
VIEGKDKGRRVSVLSGGYRSGWAYFTDELEDDEGNARSQARGYVKTDRTVTLGRVAELQHCVMRVADRKRLADVEATVWQLARPS